MPRYGVGVNELPADDQVNLLVVTARPSDLSEMPEHDKQSILDGLDKALAGSQITINELPKATLEALSYYLHEHEYKLDKPHLLHFDGHGDFGRCCAAGHFTNRKNVTDCPNENCQEKLPKEFSGYIAFEHNNGNAHWVNAEDFAETLKAHDIRLVVLNACKLGLARHGKNIFNGVAQQLIRKIPAVVATPFPLDSQAAERFASYFYQSLGNGKLLIEAMEQARNRLYGTTQREWYRLVLYLRVNKDEKVRLLNLSKDASTESTKPNLTHLPKDVPIKLVELMSPAHINSLGNIAYHSQLWVLQNYNEQARLIFLHSLIQTDDAHRLDFVTRLKPMMKTQEAKAWLNQVAHELGLTLEESHCSKQEQFYLLIKITPNKHALLKKSYFVEAWFLKNSQQPQKILMDFKAVSLQNLPNIIKEIIYDNIYPNNDENFSKEHLTLEFFLPKDLLALR